MQAMPVNNLHHEVAKATTMRPVSQQLFLWLFLLVFSSAKGEGSRELNSSTAPLSYRVFLSYAELGASFGFYRVTPQDTLFAKSSIFVYANPGDSICVASSAIGIGLGAILVFRPDGSVLRNYTTRPGDTGFIRPGAGSKVREQNGPFGFYTGAISNFYTPHVVVATEPGIYRVEFVSPNPNTSNGRYDGQTVFPSGNAPTNNSPLATADFQQTSNNVLISAWDVSIIRNGSIQLGRVYSEYLQLSNGRALHNSPPTPRVMPDNKFSMEALTRDGFRYRITYHGISGDGFSLFADNSGLQLADGQTPAYRSLQLNPSNPPTGFRIFNPFREPENAFETRHKLFFNTPDANMPATAAGSAGITWLNPNLVSAQEIDIVYALSGSPNPLSGQAIFDFPNIGIRYRLRLDLNQNGIFGDAGDFVLSGVTLPGTNLVPWNGLDSSGSQVSANFCYDMRLELIAGELHLPIIDAEHMRGGISVTRLNGSGTVPNDTIHWNDLPMNDMTHLPGFIRSTPLGGLSSADGTVRRFEEQQTLPASQPLGYTSNPTHATGNYGDNKYLDQWTQDTLESRILSPFLCFVILPLRFLDVSVATEQNTHRIYWQMAELKASTVFEIQRSKDGLHFEKIAEMTARAGQSKFEISTSRTRHKCFYRIRAISGGEVQTSRVLVTEGDRSLTGNLQLQPNPAQNWLQVQLPETDLNMAGTIRILDLSGQQVFSLLTGNGRNVQINITQLPAGLFIFEYRLKDGNVWREKFVKSR